MKRCKAGFRRKVILVRPEEGLWQCNPSSSWRFLTRVWTPVWECHLSEIIFFCWTSVCGLSATMLPVLHQFLFYFWVLVLCMGRFQPFCRTIHVGLIWYTSIYMRHCWSYIIWNNLFPHYHTYVSVTCFPATRAPRVSWGRALSCSQFLSLQHQNQVRWFLIVWILATLDTALYVW